MQRRMGQDLTEGGVTSRLIRFSFPFMLSNTLQTLYGMVDMLVVGNYVGETGLSAVNNASLIILLMTTICMGFSMSGQIYVAQLCGARMNNRLNRAIGTLFAALIVLSAFMTIVSLTLVEPMLSLMHIADAVRPLARDYLMICGGGIVFTFGYNMITSVLRGMGESVWPLIFIAIASVMNILMDLLFVGVFKWGTAGAALATIIGQAMSFIASLIFLYKRKESFGFDFKLSSLKPEREALKVYMKLGFPYAIQMSALSISMLFVNGLINAYCDVACSAAFGISNKIQHIPDILSRSIGMAISCMVGQNVAAGKLKRTKQTVYTGLAITTTVYALSTIVTLLFYKESFALFSREESILKYAWCCSLCMIIGFPAHAMMKPTNSFVQGIGNAKFSLFVAFADGVFARMTLCWLLGVVLGQTFFGETMGMGQMGVPFGFFLGYHLATYFTAIPTTIYFFSGLWKKRRLLISAPPDNPHED